MPQSVDLAEIARQHGRYAVEAYAFVGDGLRFAAQSLGRKVGVGHHLSAQELLDGVLALAVQRYGLLARLVLADWGLLASGDVGHITYHLIEGGVFGRHPRDRLEDFAVGPDFPSEIERRARARLAAAEA